MSNPQPLHIVKLPDLTVAIPEPGKSVAKSQLVNRLNYLNFQDQSILVGLKHLSYDNTVTLRARPLPCSGERLDCTWAEIPSLQQLLKNYRFDYLLIPDGKKYLLVNPEIIALSEEGLSCTLPVSCREFQLRRIKRHASSGVAVQLSQHGALFHGEVLDFTPVSLRTQALTTAPETFYWINPETPLNLRLSAGEDVLYSGACEILWQSRLRAGRTLVLTQLNQSMHRFKVKRYRNTRQQLVPSPNIIFEHPIIGRRVNLKVDDLSGSGFSVEENEEDSVLMPGMIIPRLKLSFAQGLSLRCRAQVVFRNTPTGEAGEGTIRCGVAILDMDIRDHVKLLSILHQAANRKTYVGTEVDLDDLWSFFFETGFIYPEKYGYFQDNKEQIKRTYAKLYGENPQIARYFIYQERGVILGHMAMVRFYQDSWLIHHHAARKTVSLKAGIAVLDQIGHYLNELGNFYFAHLRFVYCFYRPDNKFPSRVFGGFARQQRNPRVCSLDKFAYAHYRWEAGEAGEASEAGQAGQAAAHDLGGAWELGSSSAFDHSELASFYGFASGGLMIEAFDLQPGADPGELAQQYRRLGFKKETYYYSLRREGSLKAFIMANCTDAGFNMAGLTNCVTLVLLDETTPPELVRLSLERVSCHYEGSEMPVLTYPYSYVEKHALPCDKVYQLWILNLQYSDEYFKYCDTLFKSVKKQD
jgi:hypothetical protein